MAQFQQTQSQQTPALLSGSTYWRMTTQDFSSPWLDLATWAKSLIDSWHTAGTGYQEHKADGNEPKVASASDPDGTDAWFSFISSSDTYFWKEISMMQCIYIKYEYDVSYKIFTKLTGYTYKENKKSILFCGHIKKLCICKYFKLTCTENSIKWAKIMLNSQQ